tara:strand:- start:680 stop:841 length:162 start_codon:yes stop_codon:yes gene_type:complete
MVIEVEPSVAQSLIGKGIAEQLVQKQPQTAAAEPRAEKAIRVNKRQPRKQVAV